LYTRPRALVNLTSPNGCTATMSDARIQDFCLEQGRDTVTWK
jgi:hypothetical protein